MRSSGEVKCISSLTFSTNQNKDKVNYGKIIFTIVFIYLEKKTENEKLYNDSSNIVGGVGIVRLRRI
jgi:hypothetical protein